jgi:hypothetical protein
MEKEVEPERLTAFGVSICSRYGQAGEIIEMLNFVQECAAQGIVKYLDSVFYDSNASMCTIKYRVLEENSPIALAIFENAKKHISQFMWLDWCCHSDAIDGT